jgi:AMP phosphorylase
LSEKFTRLGEKLGIKVYPIITNGSQPCGNGVGPALEAIDVLKVLYNDPTMPIDLLEKSVLFAGKALELGGKAKEGEGEALALEILKSGKALTQFRRIIKAQGGDPNIKISDIKPGKYTFDLVSGCEGVITMINNNVISKCARAAGAPHNKGAGAFIIAKLSMPVKKGELLMRIHSESEIKLSRAIDVIKGTSPFTVQ